MKKILITGATGNVGAEVIYRLRAKEDANIQIIAGLRDEHSDGSFSQMADIRTTHFDFADQKSIRKALSDCDTLFLLRPPQLSDVKTYFDPIIQKAVDNQVGHIVFLSVQGADTSSFIPHHKIEKLIEQSGLPFTFLRPAYFMQNFTTTLRGDIIDKNRVYLPAGNAKFAIIDVEDIGKVAAEVLCSPHDHAGQAYDLTNEELWSFREMTDIISDIVDREIRYISPNLLSFYLTKRREGVAPAYIFVMIMLHFLPRFQKQPSLSNRVEALTSEKPRSFAEFVEKNRSLLQKE